ncbi:MAG: response regulator [Betaproteobacteria bacterium]
MSAIPEQTPQKQKHLLDSARRGSLLLVDDEENILSSLRRLLRPDGYQILTANCGESALELLDHQLVDVIVSDQRMPGMTGTEFLRRVRDRFPETIRIVLSGYTELDSVTSAINDGAIYKFLTKPWEDEQLRSNISEAFGRKRLDDENRRLHAELETANTRLAAILDVRERDLSVGLAALKFSHALIAILPCPIIGLDDENLIVFVNDAVERMLGRSILGESILRELPGDWTAILESNKDAETRLQIGGLTYRLVCTQLDGEDYLRGRVLSFFEVFE